ncbi:MAG: hypothetical protein P1U44_01505 [Vicingaceae bacterium]|nr:hypothetical protein [Vicingaceae bacterium]
MKLTLYIYIFLAAIFLNNCTGSSNIKSKEESIVGEWVVQEAKFKGTSDELNFSNEEINLYTFFGSTIWLKAKGNSFKFNDDGSWSSSMIPMEIIDKVKLKYEFDKNIMIDAYMILDSTTYEFEVVVDELESNSMVWKFGNYMDVRLEKK